MQNITAEKLVNKPQMKFARVSAGVGMLQLSVPSKTHPIQYMINNSPMSRHTPNFLSVPQKSGISTIHPSTTLSNQHSILERALHLQNSKNQNEGTAHENFHYYSGLHSPYENAY